MKWILIETSTESLVDKRCLLWSDSGRGSVPSTEEQMYLHYKVTRFIKMWRKERENRATVDRHYMNLGANATNRDITAFSDTINCSWAFNPMRQTYYFINNELPGDE